MSKHSNKRNWDFVQISVSFCLVWVILIYFGTVKGTSALRPLSVRADSASLFGQDHPFILLCINDNKQTRIQRERQGTNWRRHEWQSDTMSRTSGSYEQQQNTSCTKFRQLFTDDRNDFVNSTNITQVRWLASNNIERKRGLITTLRQWIYSPSSMLFVRKTSTKLSCQARIRYGQH
jgi:hypothetical protein